MVNYVSNTLNQPTNTNKIIIDFYYQIYLVKSNYDPIRTQLKILNETKQHFNGLTENKDFFFKDYTNYLKVARALGRVLAIIYLSFLLTIVVAAGALLITYYCKKKNQQFWILPMHITWNALRFFIFSFFMYGFGYGMFYCLSKDYIGFFQYAFSKDNLNSHEVVIIPKNIKDLLNYCLYQTNYTLDLYNNNGFNGLIYSSYYMDQIMSKKCQNTPTGSDRSCDIYNNGIQDKDIIGAKELYGKIYTFVRDYDSVVQRGENIFNALDCSFVNNTLNLMYDSLWDFSWETRILCALSCCIGFFGAIAVYGFLWTMFLWRRGEDGNNYDERKPLNNNKMNKKTNLIQKRNIRAPKSKNNFGGDEEEEEENEE